MKHAITFVGPLGAGKTNMREKVKVLGYQEVGADQILEGSKPIRGELLLVSRWPMSSLELSESLIRKLKGGGYHLSLFILLVERQMAIERALARTNLPNQGQALTVDAVGEKFDQYARETPVLLNRLQKQFDAFSQISTNSGIRSASLDFMRHFSGHQERAKTLYGVRVSAFS